jgi:uncharacterized protein (TIRG00374 family)
VQGVELADRKSRLRGRTLRWALSVLGILIFGVILYNGGVEALGRVAQVNLWYLAWAFVAAASAAYVTSLRWGLIVEALEGSTGRSKLRYFYYVMMGKISSTFVSQYVGDYGVRPLALKASGATSMGRAVYSVLLDRFFDLMLSLLLLVPVSLYLAEVVSIEIFWMLVVVFLGGYWTVIAKNHHLVSGLLGVVATGVRGLGRRMTTGARLVDRVATTVDGARAGFEQVGSRCINLANVVTLCRYVAMAMRAYFVALALGLTIPFWLIFLAVGLVRFALLFAVAPGRLGVLEVGWYGVLALGGVPTTSIVPFLIGLRVYGLVFDAILVLAAHLAVSLRANRLG